MRLTAKWSAIACLAGYLALGAAPLHAEWTQNGVGICTTTSSKAFPQIVSDGSGGAIVAWSEYRTTWNIYAQRVDATGAILWGASGTAVCDFVGAQRYPLIVTDGAGGAIIVWYDDRNGNSDVYVQRVDASGAAQWTANGVALTTASGDQYHYGIASDGAGGAIVSMRDGGGAGDIYVQRISANGAVLWAANGVPVCATADNESNPQVASDGAHGVIVAFSRLVGSQNFTFAGRVDAAGTALWAAEGVPLCTASGSQQGLKMIDSGSGGAIVAWQDYRSGSHIYAQLVDTTGAIYWGATGAAVCTASGTQISPQVAADGAGGAIVTWADSRNGNSDIYAQRMSAAGTAVWAANGIAVCTAADAQDQCQIASDGAGGAVISWRDLRAGAADYNIYMQRIDAGGAPLWTGDGVVACAAANAQQDAVITCDGALGAIAAWMDLRSGSAAIYAHRENPIVATFLQSFAAGVNGDCIELSWTLSEAGADVRFFIQRALGPDREFEEIVNPGIARSDLSFSFADCSCAPGDAVRYRVMVEDSGGRRQLFETDAVALAFARLALFQNRPNPFNPSTTIGYYLPTAVRVTIEIYDPAGRSVARLVDAVQEKGSHEAAWNGKNGAGAAVGSGVYFCRLTAGKETLTKKMVLLR